MISAPQIGSGISARVNALHLSESERLRVNAYLHDGEFIADLLCSRPRLGLSLSAGSVACCQ